MSEESFIDQIKNDLASMPIRTEPKNAREVVVSLKDNILESLEKKDASIEDIFQVVRKRTPEKIKMSYHTFKKYWQETQGATGLIKKRRKGNRKKNASQPMTGRLKQPVATQQEVTNHTGKEDPFLSDVHLREMEQLIEEDYLKDA